MLAEPNHEAQHLWGPKSFHIDLLQLRSLEFCVFVSASQITSGLSLRGVLQLSKAVLSESVLLSVWPSHRHGHSAPATKRSRETGFEASLRFAPAIFKILVTLAVRIHTFMLDDARSRSRETHKAGAAAQISFRSWQHPGNAKKRHDNSVLKEKAPLILGRHSIGSPDLHQRIFKLKTEVMLNGLVRQAKGTQQNGSMHRALGKTTTTAGTGRAELPDCHKQSKTKLLACMTGAKLRVVSRRRLTRNDIEPRHSGKTKSCCSHTASQEGERWEVFRVAIFESLVALASLTLSKLLGSHGRDLMPLRKQNHHVPAEILQSHVLEASPTLITGTY